MLNLSKLVTALESAVTKTGLPIMQTAWVNNSPDALIGAIEIPDHPVPFLVRWNSDGVASLSDGQAEVLDAINMANGTTYTAQSFDLEATT